MIVNPPLHAAYVYDMLAILAVKVVASPTPMNKSNGEELTNYLMRVVGEHSKIIESPEMAELMIANQHVFDLINLIKTRPATGEDATAIDMGNHRRYLAKLALQKRFFPDCPFTEQKIGYDKGAA